jgi:hypothetical protein
MSTAGKIILGRDSATQAPISIDLETLLRSKLLVQASSGGGKSRTLRRLAEQAFGKVPVIVIDPEGEFASLREKFGFLLVGKDGDVPISVETAPLLAERLLRTGISVVIDLFEVKAGERHAWVRAFLDALMEARRELWRDYLILIDEAEGFAPESGEGESTAKAAVLDVAQRGRKRGYALVLATLRVSRLDKSVLAEMQNALVGLVTMDVDLDRASNAMGIKRGKPRDEFQAGLSKLPPGRFFARGRCFVPACDTPTLLHVEGVTTTHPEPGARKVQPPPPPTQIQGLLVHFKDIPREAAQTAETVESLRARIAELETALHDAGQDRIEAGLMPEPAPPEPVEVPTVPAGLPDAVAHVKELGERLHGALAQLIPVMQDVPIRLALLDDLMAGTREWNGVPARTFFLNEQHELPRAQRGVGSGIRPAPGMRELERIEGGVSETRGRPREMSRVMAGKPGEYSPRAGARRMLQAIAESMKPPTWRQVATLAKVKITGGTFGTYKGELLANACVEERSELVYLTAAGRRHVGAVNRPRNGAELFRYWLDKPGIRGKTKNLLAHIVQRVGKGRTVERDSWLRASGIEAVDGGTAGTYIGILVNNGLVEKVGRSQFKAADMFFQ